MSSTQEDTLPKEGKMSTLEELMRQKDALEAEILKLEQEIYNHGVGLTGKLVDEEGFPRADIDIPTILTLRHNFNCKRNDYKRLMEDINKVLIGMHQEKRQKAQAGAQDKPFAIISNVAANSPAHEAGFVERDKVVRFGYVDQENHQRLKKLQELVQKTDGQEITVLVERVVEGDIQRVALKVRPRTGWGGNGKLGCKLDVL